MSYLGEVIRTLNDSFVLHYKNKSVLLHGPDLWPANSPNQTSTPSNTAFGAVYSIMYTRSR